MSPFAAWVESLGPWPLGILVIGGFVGATVIIGHIITRVASNDLLREHNDLAGFIFAIVGVQYAVVLGFVTIGAWDRFTAANERSYAEAAALVSAYRDAGALPNGKRLRTDIRDYVEQSVNKAWPEIARGISSHEADAQAEKTALDADRIVPRNEAQANLDDRILADLDESFADRDLRLGEGVYGLNPVMWTVVYAGAGITIGFSLLFGFRSRRMQAAMVGALAGIISLLIYLTVCLDYPYSGVIRVGPEAMERALATFSEVDTAGIHR